MAACRTCGRDAGRLRTQCTDCREREKQRAAEAERQALEADERAEEERRRSIADELWGDIQSTLDQGRLAYLYRSVYVPVDSILQDEVLGTFDIEELQRLGLEGWEIVAVVPRTAGISLENYTGLTTQAWGGGIGGNVMGVHVLLRYAVTPEGLEASRDDIDDFLMEDD
jgi:hypothetical protein